MSRGSATVALVACAAFSIASETLHAQARGPAAHAAVRDERQVDTPPLVMDEATRARKIAEMRAWLARVAGLFRVEARFTVRDPFTQKDTTAQLTGSARCTDIGNSPGVRCFIGVIRPPHVPPDDRNYVIWQPGIIYHQPILYFGIDATNLRIQVLVADVHWVAAQTGSLAADRVEFTTDNWNVCHHMTNGCWVIDEIAADSAEDILMKIHVDGARSAVASSGHTHDIELHLHRERPGTGPAASGK